MKKIIIFMLCGFALIGNSDCAENPDNNNGDMSRQLITGVSDESAAQGSSNTKKALNHVVNNSNQYAYTLQVMSMLLVAYRSHSDNCCTSSFVNDLHMSVFGLYFLSLIAYVYKLCKK